MSIRLTTEQFITKSIIIHGYKYDYSLVNYINSSTRVEIICPIHGIFLQIPENHLAKDIRGCYQCGRDRTNNSIKNRILSKNDFIAQATLLHNNNNNNNYDYSKIEYINSVTKIIIICLIHGDFKQAPIKHLLGQGCFKCGRYSAGQKLSLSLSDFIGQANKIHENKYNYNKVNYINFQIKIEILCPIHGAFNQTPNAHLRGQGCPKCGNNSISKLEELWLDSLNIKPEKRSKILFINGQRFWVDALDHNINTIYEYYGDFWHGNPKVFKSDDINPRNKISYGILYKNTIERENIFKNYGYKLISIWENDFER